MHRNGMKQEGAGKIYLTLNMELQHVLVNKVKDFWVS
jgi:hypothetical protein